MTVRVLMVMAVLIALYGCGQSSLGLEQGEKEDVEKAVGEKKPEGTQKPETTARVAPGYTTSEQASADAAKAAADAEVTHDAQASASASANAEFDRNQCRLDNYVVEENMSGAEAKTFAGEMADYLLDDIEAGGDATLQDFLDEAGVPAYEELCGG